MKEIQAEKEEAKDSSVYTHDHTCWKSYQSIIKTVRINMFNNGAVYISTQKSVFLYRNYKLSKNKNYENSICNNNNNKMKYSGENLRQAQDVYAIFINVYHTHEL